MRTTTRTSRLVSVSLGCLLASLIVIGAACSKQETPAPAPSTPEPNATSEPSMPTPSGVPEPVAAPNATEPNAVVATVNGEVITEAQLNAGIDYYVRSDPQVAMLPPQYASQIRSVLRPRVLDTLVGQTLMKQEAKAAGIEVSDEEVMATLEQTAAAQDPPLTIDQFKQMLAAQGGDFNEILDSFREGLLLEKFATEKFADQLEITEGEARAYYDEHIEDFNQPEVVQVSHIMLGHTASADPNSDPNKIKAEELLAEIRGGADFAQVAMDNSTDQGSKMRGGRLGYLQRGPMAGPFEDAAFALEPNEVSDVVETQYGFHIIKVTDHRDAGITPFDEVKARIIQVLEQQRRSDLVNQYVNTLKETATIEYPADSNAPAPTAPPTPMTITPAPIDRTPRTSEPNTN